MVSNKTIGIILLVVAFLAFSAFSVSSVRAYASPAAVDLGNATDFAILSYAGISSGTNADVITGDIGVSPTAGTSIGVFCSEINGTIWQVSNTYVGSGDISCAVNGTDNDNAGKNYVDQAILDANAAISDANGRFVDDTNLNFNGGVGCSGGTCDLAGLTFVPGVYTFTGPGNVIITDDIYLSGSSSDVWIFIIPGTLDISSAKSVILTGSAQASNIFWSVAGNTQLQTTSDFSGTILEAGAVLAMLNGATLNGRAIAPVIGPTGAVTTTGIVTVTIPILSSSEPPEHCGGSIPCNCTAGTNSLNESRIFNETDDLAGCTDGLSIDALNVSLDCNNMEIIGSGSGYGISVNYNNVTVKNCTISNFYDGIYVSEQTNLTFENNTIYDMSNNGIGGSGGNNWIKITDSEIYNTVNGISLIAARDGDIIENNYIHNVSNSGIQVTWMINANINDNVIESASYSGIDIGTVDNSSLTGNELSNNGYGLYIDGCDNLTLEDNDFTSNAYDGIYSGSSDVYVTNGNFINNGHDSEVAYGIYDNSGPSVHWTVTEPVDCINNSIYLWGDMTGIENVDSENCPIYVNDECVSGDCPVECGLYASEDFTFTGDMECYSGTFAGVTVQADNITIDCNGYSITKNEQTGHGIDVSGYTNVTIKNCEVSGFFNGIVLSNSDNSTINNNYVYDNSHHNIEIKSGSDYNIISRNRVETGFVGINLKASANNDVWHNTAFNNSAAGIRLSGASGSDVYNNTISNNVESIGNGIDVGSSSTENVIRGNTITENRVGIFYADSGENLIANNNINNNCEGMLVSNADVDIEDTDFTSNSEFALEECDQYASPGLNVQSSTVDILNSNFENNGWYGIYGDSDSIINFTIDDETSCTNNVLRYYGEISDSEDLIRTNCPIALNDGQESDVTCGSEITESITLTESLECGSDGLIANASSITIDCNGWSIVGPGSFYGISVSEFNDVTIKNCDINNFEYGVYVDDSNSTDILNNLVTYSSYGVYITGSVDDSDHTISGNIIDAISTNAIYIYNESSNTVQNNRIRYVDGSGIYIEGIPLSDDDMEPGPIGSDHTISGNTIMNASVECDSGCGAIELQYEDNCEINNNVIAYSGYNGISLKDTSETEISDNTITDVYNMGIRLADSDGDGYGNTVDGNTVSGPQCIGIRVATSNNTITDNTFTGDGTFTCSYEQWSGWSAGVYLGDGNSEEENNQFSGNDVSGYYDGFYANNIENFTINGDEYYDNLYGLELYNVGGVDTDPLIENTKANDNEEEGVYVFNSILEIKNCEFKRNLGYPDTGLYNDNSAIYLVNGNFEDNNGYGLYQNSGQVSWQITGPTTCKNNDIEITNGFITYNGGTLTSENCTITANYSEYISILPGENYTVEGDYLQLNIYSDDGYDGTITVTTSPTMPENYSGYTLTPFGTWMTFEAPGLNDNMTWAIIKIYYTDEQLAALNMDEDSLVIQYYNVTDETWEIFSDPKGGLGSDDNGKYVWANTTHFSGFGVFGSTIVTSTGGASMAIGGANVTYVAPGEEGTQPEVPSESIVTPVGEIPTDMVPIIVLVVLVGLGIVAYTMLKPKKKR